MTATPLLTPHSLPLWLSSEQLGHRTLSASKGTTTLALPMGVPASGATLMPVPAGIMGGTSSIMQLVALIALVIILWEICRWVILKAVRCCWCCCERQKGNGRNKSTATLSSTSTTTIPGTTCTLWIAPLSGSRYHYTSSCGALVASRSVKMYTPCILCAKKCA